MSVSFDISVNGISQENVVLEDIFKYKDEDSLRITTTNSELKYSEFKKLALVRKLINKLESDSKEQIDVKTVHVEEDIKEIVEDIFETSFCLFESLTMAKFELSTAIKLINIFEGNNSDVLDFTRSVNYLASSFGPEDDKTSEGERKKLIDFLLNIKIKGHARQVFLRTPTSIKQVCDQLLQRFKPRETMADLTDQLHSLSQEQRTVDNFAKEIEQISYKLLQLHMIGKGDAAEATVREMNEFVVIEAFKRGLRKELKDAVVAARVTTLGDAIDIAQAAESAHKSEPNNILAVDSRDNVRNDRSNNRRKKKGFTNNFYTNNSGPPPTLGRGQYSGVGNRGQQFSPMYHAHYNYPRSQGPVYAGQGAPAYPYNQGPRYGGRGGAYVGNNATVYQYGPCPPTNGIPEYEQVAPHINMVQQTQNPMSPGQNYHENHHGALEFFR